MTLIRTPPRAVDGPGWPSRCCGRHYRGVHSRAFRWTVPIAALVAVLVVAAPAWAGTVEIQDDAHVLNATAVQNAAATLPVGVYVWATTQDAENKSTFDTDVRNKVSPTFPVVIGINTRSRHESIQISSRVGLSQSAALAVESSANTAFVASMQSRHDDYTAAVTAALGTLHTGLAGAHRGRVAAQRAPEHSSGGGFLLIMLIIGVIVVVVLLLRRRNRSGSRMGEPARGPWMGPGPSPMASYPDYGPSYRSGMSPGAAGALGAVGGGLLGYELGKMQGEEHQFHQDERAFDHDHGGQSADQGNWVVGQDGDFPDGGSSSGTGDW
jgi:uncharacterized membrane protein